MRSSTLDSRSDDRLLSPTQAAGERWQTITRTLQGRDQFRGWRTAQYVANFTKLVELQLQLCKMVVDDPTLAPIGLALPAEDQGEATRGHFYNLMQLSVRNCLVQPSALSVARGLLCLVGRQHGHDHQATSLSDHVGSDQTKILHEGFHQYMEQVMEATRMPESCYTPTKDHISSTSASSARRVQI
jgi:hypothetical protein